MNRKGYYLFEVVLILSIITSFLLFLPIKKTSCSSCLNQFTKILENDLEYGIGYTLNHFTLVNLYTIPEQNTYFLRDGNLEIVLVRKFDKKLKIKKIEIRMSHGYVIKNYQFTISCNNENYQIFITEKSGKVNVFKE